MNTCVKVYPGEKEIFLPYPTRIIERLDGYTISKYRNAVNASNGFTGEYDEQLKRRLHRVTLCNALCWKVNREGVTVCFEICYNYNCCDSDYFCRKHYDQMNSFKKNEYYEDVLFRTQKTLSNAYREIKKNRKYIENIEQKYKEKVNEDHETLSKMRKLIKNFENDKTLSKMRKLIKKFGNHTTLDDTLSSNAKRPHIDNN